MERIYRLLQAYGYPADGINWLRKRRFRVIVFLAAGAWALTIGLIWLVIWLLA
jgi:hypothetical protein